MYHQRSSYLWEKTYLWPEEDIWLWKHLNREKYGPRVLDYICDLALNHDVIIQAGGACGIYPDYYSNYFKEVYTFEPDPTNYHCLVENAPSVYKTKCALGAESGHGYIKNKRKNFGTTHICNDYEIENELYTDETQIITIDELNIKPDVIHLDVERYETEVLRGAYNTIMKHSPLLVLETADDYVTDVLGYNFIGKIGADQIFFKKNEKKVI